MKIVLISDTHEKHDQVTAIPSCDVLIHAGDLTMNGRPSRTLDAFDWLNNQPAKHVVVIGGNHDFFLERSPDSVRDLLGSYRIHYLEDSGIVLDGIKFWGSPYTPRFHDWAFMYNREGTNRWDWIPGDTNVLITHGPPMYILDQVVPGSSEALGCFDLRQTVLSLPELKMHVFGHIHGGFGQKEIDGRFFFNASVCDESYAVSNPGFTVNYEEL